MKITEIRCVPYSYELRRPIGDVHLPEGVRHGTDLAVFVETDEGLTGTTIGWAAAAGAIAQLEPMLLGEDPRSVTGLWHRMVSVAFKAGNVGPIKGAIAAIDCALWDLRARANDVPLWKELGATSPTVTAYASGLDTPLSDDDLSAYYERMARCGVRAGKLKVGRDRRADRRRLEVMASALPEGSALMIDANEFWSVKQAVQHARELERDHELAWVEEPTSRYDVEGLRRISDAIDAPVATGENLNQVHEFVPLVKAGAADVVQIGMHTSGITGAMQVADLALAFGLPVAMMNCPGRFIAHLAAALPHHTMMEVLDAGRDAALVSQPEIVDGQIVLGAEPGSGVDFDPERLAELSQARPGGSTLGAVYRRADDAGGVG